MPLLADADALAAAAHAGQTRRHGAAYIDHPRAVARIAADLAAVTGVALDDDARAAALCHDVIEDSPTHPREVVAARLGERVAAAVTHLTKTGKGEEAVAAYYATLRRDGLTSTKLIKVCDRLHNLSELHKPQTDAASKRKKLFEYVEETKKFVLPLAADVGLTGAVEEAIDNARRNQGDVDDPRAFGIYAIVDDVARLQTLVDGGVARVQLRQKHADTDRALIDVVKAAAAVCAPRNVMLLVNDRVDIAVAGGAFGVHLGQTDLPAKVARLILGATAYIGVSNHTLAQLKASDVDVIHDGADHLALGPIWPSPTKQGHADVVGLDVLREACAATAKPVVAIGGIVDVDRVVEVARAGAAYAAVVSAFNVDDPAALHLLVRRFALSFAATRKFT